MTYIRRKIDLTFQLGTGSFGTGGFDTVKVSGLRVQANIANAGGPSMGTANLRVYGMALQTMNELAQIVRSSNGIPEARWNNLLIDAGDDTVGMSHVFAGQIKLAPIDFSSPPDATLTIAAFAGGFQGVQAIEPTSYPGSADVAVILQNLASAATPPMDFVNNGVSVILATPYFTGSVREQIRAAAEAANIDWTIDKNVLMITPKGVPLGALIPLVSPDTGMVGYPVNWNFGVAVRTLFNPALQVLGQVRVKSSLPFANGVFLMHDIAHELESEMPGGQWFTSFHGSPFNA